MRRVLSTATPLVRCPNAACASSIEASSHEKKSCFVGWVLDGALVGHSSVGSGHGRAFFEMSARFFADKFRLKTIVCEPYAENPGPNRVLQKTSFRFVKTYETIPGNINFLQMVNRWEWKVDEAR